MVDKRKVPDYYELIRHPICLSEIKDKALFCQYQSAAEFVDDVILLLDNCYSYNEVRRRYKPIGKICGVSGVSSKSNFGM